MTGQEIFYVVLGLVMSGAVFPINRHLYGAGAKLGVTGLEAFYYGVALAALVTGWYFNILYFREYAGEYGWWHWCKLLFVNPASASGAQDLIYANVLLFPLWTIYDGRRRGMKAPWYYFPLSLFTSYAFAFAMFLAVQERQLRISRSTSGGP